MNRFPIASSTRRPLLVLLAVAIACPGASAAEFAAGARRSRPANEPYAPIQASPADGEIAEIEMFVGESRVFPAPGVARIAVGNGSLMSAAALDGKEVILFANGVGTSSLFIWNGDGRYQRVKINIVPGDTSRYAREIAAFLSSIPKARASVVGSNIIVEGEELSDADLAKIDELARRYPQIVNFSNRLGWEKMVAIDVKVVEFPTSLLHQTGLNWTPTGGAALGAIWQPLRRGSNGPYQLNQIAGTDNAAPIVDPNGGPVLLPRGLNILSALNIGLNAQLNLLAQEGKASLLAEPQLSTRSGSRASFIAGGEIPYTAQTKDGIVVQFKSYGVKLSITPKVDASGIIRATIDSEVSSIDRSVTTPNGPGLLTRKTETEFNVREGETIVLSGLLQRESSKDIDKIPLLGDIPVLGALFRSKRYQNKETELVVFVTPTVVNAGSVGNRARIESTTERLAQQMGPQPYLSDPLQPGVAYEKPNATPQSGRGASPPAAAASASAAPAQAVPPIAEPSDAGAVLRVRARSTALRSRPAADAPIALTLPRSAVVQLGREDAQPTGTGRWLNARVGSINGWLLADAVEPWLGPSKEDESRTGPGANRAAAPRPVLLASTVELGQSFRVEGEAQAVRLTPDVNATAITRVSKGDIVRGLKLPPQGPWLPVQVGSATGKRGWMLAQWLVPVPAP